MRNSLATLLALLAATTGFADIRIVAPKPGEVVPVLTESQHAFLNLSPAEKRKKFADKDYRRKEMGLPVEVVDGVPRQSWWPKTTRLEWEAKEGVTVYAVKVVGRNGDLAFDQCVTGTTAVIDNLMVATDYDWTVSAKGETGASSFRTEDVPLRLCRFPSVENARDLGGAKGLGGRRVKQGMIYRSRRFNEKTHKTFYTEDELREKGLTNLIGKSGHVLKNKREAVKSRALGEPFGTPEDRAYIVRRFGIKTDLDIRAGEELYGLVESPLGNGVKLVKLNFGAYKGAVGDYGKIYFKKIFKFLQDESVYPVDFHCSAGQDRTGSLAYLLEALLGIDDEHLADEWAYTGFYNRSAGFCHAKFYDALPRELKKRYPAPTTRESAEAFVRAAGITDEEIANFRRLMLE